MKVSEDIVVKLMDGYNNGNSMREIAENVGLNQFTVRRWFLEKGLAIKVADREISQEAFIERSDCSDTNTLYKKLEVAERALIRTRDELNYRRKVQRADERNTSFEDSIVDIIKSCGYQQFPEQPRVVHEVTEMSDYTSILLLSDVHAEDSVKPENVGGMNEYNWGIMSSRIQYLFDTWLSEHRGEHDGVLLLLGDMISGIIHSTLEHTTKPTAEAVHDLANLLSSEIFRAANIFSKLHIGVVSGNHERLHEKPSSVNKGFDFGYLFAQILKAKLSNVHNITFDISTTGFTTYAVGDKVILGHHGDMFRGAYSVNRTSTIQASCEAVTGSRPDHIFEGHKHTFSYHNTPTGISVVNASLIGPNEYGLTAGFSPVRPSQTIITMDPKGVVENVRQVFLDE